MAEAHKCDRCNQLVEGSPAGKVVDSKAGLNLGVCRSCLDGILSVNFADKLPKPEPEVTPEVQPEQAAEQPVA